MRTAATRPSALSRHAAVAMAGLVLLVHSVLEPAHLISHHGSAEEQAHLAAHQGEHAGHQHHENGGPGDHSDEHDGGDHGGTGHLLEVVPNPGPVAGLSLDLVSEALPDEQLPSFASARKSIVALAEEFRPRPPPRRLAPSRAPPVG